MWSYKQYRRLGHLGAQQAPTHSTEKAEERQKLENLKSSTETDSEAKGATEEGKNEANKDDDDFVIRAAEEDDPMDPRNWPLVGRAKNIAILSLLIFVQAWAGADASMANSDASKEFGVQPIQESAYTAAYLFGIGTGALLFGPVSETVGRNPTYLVSTFCFLFFVLGTALSPNLASQVVCRFFVGLFASATLAINGASVRDQFRPVKRTFVFPVIAWANVTAPVIAPICGGWIVARTDISWRWTNWVTLIISAFAFLVALLFLPETFLPILLDWKAKQLRKATGDDRYTSEHAKGEFFSARLKRIGLLPAKFLATEPVIAVLGAYLVLLYSLLFSFLSGFEYIFKHTYNLSAGQTGACFAAIAAGTTVFLVLAPGLYSWARHHTEHVQGAAVQPEFRLWPAIYTAPLLPISLFWLGWTNQPTISIWSGLGACFCFGLVLIATYVSSYEYIIDSYGDHAAIALASITMVRYLVAGCVVMAARPMYERLGVSWTMTLLGCIAAVLAPAPLLFKIFGKKLRAKSPYAKGPEDD
ncbi:major facilitator superfamily domain-containing protein [Rhypophila decipiens]|uniref:Major facilitator superfamily domain-containing protein n=1 Tax=Rhypophila decipiens TaxID=261697 RepID=A0AAN6YF59_9PEZI|nr:major facilitator superfamily domain-containing protein [Rhypophila decipiens]